MIAQRIIVGTLVGSLLGSGNPGAWRASADGSQGGGPDRPVTSHTQALGQSPSVPRPPTGQSRAEALPEAAARLLFEEKVIRRYPEAWKKSLAEKKTRGWKSTGRFGGVRVDKPRGMQLISQSQTYESPDGLVIEHVWNCGTGDSLCSTFYIESFAYGSSISYDVEFVPDGDLSGYCRWVNPIGVDPGRDERRQRAGWRVPRVNPMIRLASSFGEAPRQNCPGDAYHWRRCMRNCIKERHEDVMRKTAAAFGTSLIGCFTPTRIDPSQVGLYIICVAGWTGWGFAMFAITEFTLDEPCDSGGECGPNPC